MINKDCIAYNEQELLARVAQGDQQAFSQIVHRYTSMINSHLSNRVKDARKAEEVSQDVFMSIWKSRDQLTAMQNFPGFVYVITTNKAKRQLKKKLLTMPELPEDRLQDPLSAADTAIEIKELTGILYRRIELLPQKRKEVFKLSRIDGLSNDEIAARLKVSKNTIREHIREALAFLRSFTDLDYLQCRRRRTTPAEARIVA